MTSAVVAVLLAFPVLVAGPAQAAPAATRASAGTGRIRPASAPSADVLQTLTDLLARLLSGAPGASSAPAVPTGLIGRVTASTVRISGVACNVRVFGSGFSPAANTIVTNAHVVAGVTNPVVLRPDGSTLAAQVQVFDPKDDLAVLAVPGLGEPALPLAGAATGESDAVFGHPLGQAAVAVTPARVVRRVTADVGDIYGQGPAVRRLLVLSARIEPGDSGAPLVNNAGQVVGVTFATAIRRPTTAFAIASEDLATVLARPRGATVSTGP
ncbi:MAG: trypsin-like peptidase domain-containing protein, partial [Actinomycetota bacterium]|nr:trypsin-like peptidase domain-containing protein [Actinomycetota bacterium]